MILGLFNEDYLTASISFTSGRIYLRIRYHSFGQNGYVFLEKNIPNHEDRPDNHTGWKIHVSIDINQVFNGMSANYVVWGVIMPVLIMEGVYQFKMALHDVPAPGANNAFQRKRK